MSSGPGRSTSVRVTREQATANREKVLYAAGTLFRQHGFDGIGVDDIMKRAGLTHGGFYGQFPSKDDLAAEACARVLGNQRWVEGLTETPKPSLGALIRAYLSADHRDDPGHGCLMAALGSDVVRQPKAVRRAFTDGFRARVVVTGVGLVSPLAVGTEPTWRAILAGRSGVAPITLFDASRYATRFAAEVKGFDPLEWLDKKDVKKCGRFIQLALAATSMAITASGLQIHAGNATRVGVMVGSGIGGFEVIEREHQVLLERGPERVSPFFIVAALVNLAAGQIAVRFGAKGPNSAVATACTTGAHAIGDAFRLIQHGYADAMICGGTEAAVTPLGIAGFS